MTVQVGVVAKILSSCGVKETLAQDIPSARQALKTIRQAAFDIKVAVDSRSARWSAFQALSAGTSYTIDLTVLPRTVPTNAGVTTFDATGLRILYWRIRNKSANNVLAVAMGNAPVGTSVSYTNQYPLLGAVAAFASGLQTPVMPIMPQQHMQAPLENLASTALPAVSATAKNIVLVPYSSGGVWASGIDAEVSLLLGP